MVEAVSKVLSEKGCASRPVVYRFLRVRPRALRGCRL